MMDPSQETRYQKTPVYLFFEKYVLNVIGELPPEKINILQQIDLQTTFGTQSVNWKEVIREVLLLSDTIDIAIRYSWFTEIDKARHQNATPNPVLFSRAFVDTYFEENSVIDVWTEKTLKEAKTFILEHEQVENA